MWQSLAEVLLAPHAQERWLDWVSTRLRLSGASRHATKYVADSSPLARWNVSTVSGS